jgi:hypothetical protein
MLDCKVMKSVHSQLAKAKFKPEITFGGAYIIFLSDFLQLPAVVTRNPNLYVDQNDWRLGHRLWGSLNAVVILAQPMRQARDPPYAALYVAAAHSEDEVCVNHYIITKWGGALS